VTRIQKLKQWISLEGSRPVWDEQVQRPLMFWIGGALLMGAHPALGVGLPLAAVVFGVACEAWARRRA
jgi:hypothetical protein